MHVQSPSIIPFPGYPLCLVSWVRCGTWLYRFLIFAPSWLWLSELFLLCCVAALKSLPALSFNALIFPIHRIACTITFFYSFPWISSLSWFLCWYLPHFLLWISELFCLSCVAAPKGLPALSLNALIITILRIVCTITFHNSFPWVSSMSCFLGQLWHLIVSIPDFYPLSYCVIKVPKRLYSICSRFYSHSPSKWGTTSAITF